MAMTDLPNQTAPLKSNLELLILAIQEHHLISHLLKIKKVEIDGRILGISSDLRRLHTLR